MISFQIYINGFRRAQRDALTYFLFLQEHLISELADMYDNENSGACETSFVEGQLQQVNEILEDFGHEELKK